MRHYPQYKLLNFRKFLSPKQTDNLSDKFHNFYSKFIEPYEVTEPKMVTFFPGAKNIEYNTKLGRIIANNQNNRDIINLEKSFGNYFNDIDNNIVLDMHMDNGKNMFGYNYRKWVQHAKFGKYDQYLYQKPSLANTPPAEYPKMLMDLLNRVGPKNLHEVLLTNGSSSAANEAAIKIAMINKLYEIKGNNNLSREEIMDAFANRKLSILGFEGGYHGNYLSTLSASNLNNNDLFTGVSNTNWPVAPFPKLKYPYN